MNYIGGFREGEINGKPFHTFTFLPQTETTPTSSFSFFSGETTIELSLQPPLFICPSLRRKAQQLKPESYIYRSLIPFDVSPHFPTTRTGDQRVQYFLDSNIQDDKICKLPVVPLFWCNNKQTNMSDSLNCLACLSSEIGTDYYFCTTCGEIFHKECVESPVFIKHPSYPSLSLQLHVRVPSHHDNCICCGKSIHNIVYHCPTNKVSIHRVCLMKPIPIVIDNPKRHPHPLTFFPKQASLACDVCGLIKELIPTYVCLRSVFVVHQDCIYFPYVIRISRHQHRISFTSYLPSGKWSCGVCRQKVDNNCGAYSCNKCDDYFVHSRCATRRDLWDGEELEGVPEEPEIVVEPFKRIVDGIILHFSHGHHLKLEISKVYDEEKFCQACVLPIYEGNFYSCMDQCDFILHESCANSPLKKHHPLHAHSLTLKVVTKGYGHGDNQGVFLCNACQRHSCGFVYEHSIRRYWRFNLDVRCASVSEPFKYEGHEHPLFLALKPEEERWAICQICQDGHKDNLCRKLNCIECNYVICFKCATLPYKARYQHDKHFLTFREAKEATGNSDWCEKCERKLVYSRKGGFYTCDDYCCTKLHVDCLLGKDPYMKRGQTVIFVKDEIHITGNNTMSRPFCHIHNEDRCRDRVVFKKKDMIFCSFLCSKRRYW